MAELPLMGLERILKKSGAKRISIKATEEYAAMLEEHVSNISRDAAALAEHARRNTILEQDILLARKRKKST